MKSISLSSINLPVVSSNEYYSNEMHVRYGIDNNFPQLMNDYASYSATHKPILKLKANMIAGGGLYTDTIEIGSFPKLNSKEKSYKTLRKIADDYARFNGFALQVLWDKTGKKWSEVLHLDFSRIRAKKDEYCQPDTYYWCRDWCKYLQKGYEPIAIPVYNPDAVMGKGIDPDGEEIDMIVQPRQIIFFYEYESGIDYYPVPSYNPAFPDIDFEYRYSKFKANSIKNGMASGTHIDVPGNPEKPEKDEFYNAMKKKFTGEDNAGEIVITYSDGQNRTVITPLQMSNNSDLFANWEKSAAQKIISAHQLSSPTLAGLPGDGTLGGNAQEILNAVESFQNNVINNYQQYIVDVLLEILPHSNFISVEDLEGLNIGTIRPITVIPDQFYELATPEKLQEFFKDKYGLDLGLDVSTQPDIPESPTQ